MCPHTENRIVKHFVFSPVFIGGPLVATSDSLVCLATNASVSALLVRSLACNAAQQTQSAHYNVLEVWLGMYLGTWGIFFVRVSRAGLA